MTSDPLTPPADAGFVPHDATQRSLRDALGRFATGVTIVTTRNAAGPVAIVANSFASVSLDPALVLWSPAKSSRRYSAFAAAEHYAIHVLGHEQADLAARFARAYEGFDLPGITENAQGVPLLPGCLARFECRAEARHDAGDHMIVVGRVLRVSFRDGAPLIFTAGRYGGFAPNDPA